MIQGDHRTSQKHKAFTNCGFRFLAPRRGLLDLGTPLFSSDYANPGESLFPGTGNGTDRVPLTTTPGYQLDRLASAGGYSIHTQNHSEYAFGTWGWVTATKRIMGGGVFQLTFAPSTTLFTAVDCRDVQLDAIYGGSGSQYIRAGVRNIPGEPRGILPCQNRLRFCFSVVRWPYSN